MNRFFLWLGRLFESNEVKELRRESKAIDAATLGLIAEHFEKYPRRADDGTE